jgi:light-regulated signal transduction histidine kinase (bacteriophytochrome)
MSRRLERPSGSLAGFFSVESTAHTIFRGRSVTPRRAWRASQDTGLDLVIDSSKERIFESFQQGQRGPSQEEGTGLGLTLCRRIVTLMGGTMSLQTEVGVGTFGFTVPMRGLVCRSPRSSTTIWILQS